MEIKMTKDELKKVNEIIELAVARGMNENRLKILLSGLVDNTKYTFRGRKTLYSLGKLCIE